jgi:hypothetical protein
MLWTLHLELDRREVPPCLRWPKRDDTPQMLFITWLADALWLAKRKPGHVPFYSRWRWFFKHRPAGEQWHKTALWVYRSGHGVGHYHSRGLGLDDTDKQSLMTMVSNRMRGDREILKRLPELRDQIWLAATSTPDRSGRVTARDTADRRTELLRLFLLAGRNLTLAVHYLNLLTGEVLSRQTLTRQIERVEMATRLRLLQSQ